MLKIKKIFIRLLVELWIIYEWFWGLIPGRLGMFIRKITIAPFLSYKGSKFKNLWSVDISEFVHFWKPWNVIVGKNVRFGKYSQINAEEKIIIGNHVMMGPYVMITTVTHGYKEKHIPMRKQKSTTSPIEIEDDVWIGGHVSILPGVKIKRGIIVGAGAVVSKSLKEPFGVYVGVPAKLKFKR